MSIEMVQMNSYFGGIARRLRPISGVEGMVEIESQWMAWKREQLGVVLGMESQNPCPVPAQDADTRTGHLPI
jgi:hypothetical protein